MAFLQHKNNAVSSISTPGGINNTATSVSIQSGDTGLFPASGTFEVTLWPANTNPTFANSEIVLVTAGQGTGTFTITRAQEGTTAKNFNQGDNIALLMTAKQLTDIESVLQGGTQGAILYFNSSGALVQLTPGTNGQVLSTQGPGQNPQWANSASGSSGWISDPNTWTYASAQSFTITGNVTSQYTTGTKLQWTDSGGVKYGVVISSSFSNPNTTITIATNNDFSFANSAITSNSYSYAAAPPGYPTWFNYTPTLTGGTSPQTFTRFKLDGKACTVDLQQCRVASNSTSFSITLPVTPTTSITGAIDVYLVIVNDNNTWQNNPGIVGITANVSAALIGITISTQSGNVFGGFTASGNKDITGEFTYPV